MSYFDDNEEWILRRAARGRPLSVKKDARRKEINGVIKRYADAEADERPHIWQALMILLDKELRP